jgi:anthranilate synthase component 2
MTRSAWRTSPRASPTCWWSRPGRAPRPRPVFRSRRSKHFAGKLPILGVCLGHQAIGAAFGGKIIRAQQLMHGKTSVITTTRQGVFADLPEQFTVNRYHSLAIEKSSCPDVLAVTAWTDDGEIMGVRHKELPIQGVQFHPESILTEHGHAMLKNFLEQTA